MLGAISLGFIVNMAFVIVSRTAMVTMPIMLAVFALLHLKWRTSLIIFGVLVVTGGTGLGHIAALAKDAGDLLRDYQLYKTANMFRRRSDCGSSSGRNRSNSLPRRR